MFLSYVLSFVFVGIYWNNHHHMLHAARHVNGPILWANLHLLFWLSLIPFVTGWMGENHFAATPVAGYGVVLLMAGVAYYILERALIRHHGKDSALAVAVGHDFKGNVSVVLYVAAIALSFVNPWISLAHLCVRRGHVARSRPPDRADPCREIGVRPLLVQERDADGLLRQVGSVPVSTLGQCCTAARPVGKTREMA